LAYILGRSFKKFSSALGAMVLTLTLTTILLQFTSTALLSDIKNGIVEVMQFEQNISYTAEPPSALGVLAGGKFSPGYL
jgi:hypothetical protein